MKIAIIGDSRATAWGAPPGTVPFPDILSSKMAKPTEVRNFARRALRLDRYLSELDELHNFEPDLIVSFFGGRESLMRLPKAMRRLRCDPTEDLRGSGLARPILRCRQLVWGFLVLLLREYPWIGLRLWALLGADSYRTVEQYRASVSEFLNQMSPRAAYVVLVEHFSSQMVMFPWKEPVKIENSRTMRSAAEEYENVGVLDPKRHMSFQDVFISDGVHLNQRGHEIVAEMLASHLEQLDPITLIGSRGPDCVRRPTDRGQSGELADAESSVIVATAIIR